MTLIKIIGVYLTLSKQCKGNSDCCENVPNLIEEFAKQNGVSKVVIGRTNNRAKWFYLKPTVIDRLTQSAPNGYLCNTR